MALNWNVENIEDYEQVCWIGEKGEEGRRMNPVTHALIFNSIAIGIGRITKDNAAEVFARTSIIERINGTLLQRDGKDVPIEFDDIRRHIGLSTNVSFENRKQWAMRWFVGHGDYLVKYGEKRKSESEIEALEADKDGVDVSRTEELARMYRQHIYKMEVA
jgi:hypothetical protein